MSRYCNSLIIGCCISSLFSLFTACNTEKEPESGPFPVADSSATPVEEKDTPLRLSYRLLAVNDSSLAQFTAGQWEIIGAINRIDRAKIYKTDSLVIPDTFLTDLNRYAPFPAEIPLLDSVRKILLLSYPAQAFAAYEHGQLVRWGPVSMGKKSTPTPAGLFHTNWKAKRTVSTENPEWILPWYFNLHNQRGVSLHQYELPGFPASHACIRMFPGDAEWMYHWAEQWKLSKTGQLEAYGTPTVIYGSYPFGEKAPWKQLPVNPEATVIGRDSIEKEIKPFIELILERQVPAEEK